MNQLLITLFTFALAATVYSESTVLPAPPQPLADALSDLGHPDFAKRNAATLTLWKLGPPTLPYLNHLARSSPDPETAHRAAQLALRIGFGISPDSPPDLLPFLEKYQTTPAAGRPHLIREFFRDHPDPAPAETLVSVEAGQDPTLGNPALLALAQLLHSLHTSAKHPPIQSRTAFEAVLNWLESDPDTRPAEHLKEFLEATPPPPFSQSPPPASATVPRLATQFTLSDKGLPTTLAALRDSFAAGDSRPATLRRLALFEFLAGDPDKAIKAAADKFATSPSQPSADLLILLYRLAGNLDAAADIAARFPQSGAALATFADLANWPAFQASWLSITHPSLNPVEIAGIQAALAQLANDPDSRRSALRELSSHTPSTAAEKHQQFENLVLLGESKSALELAHRNLASSPDFSTQTLYARWITHLLAAAGDHPGAITFASPLVEKHPWRSPQFSAEFAALLTSQNQKLPNWLTHHSDIPVTAISYYIPALKAAGESDVLDTFFPLNGTSSTSAHKRRFAQGHFPEAPDGLPAIWWFFLAKKFPADSPSQRLARVASRISALPGASPIPGIRPANRHTVADDVAAMFQHLDSLASSALPEKPRDHAKREIFDIWFSLLTSFAEPDNPLAEQIAHFSKPDIIAHRHAHSLAPYILQHLPPDEARASLSAVSSAKPHPIATAALAKLEPDPKRSAELLVQAHLLPLEDPASRAALIDFFFHLNQPAEAEKSRRILLALWSPLHDGFSPALLYPASSPPDPDKATSSLLAQRAWLQHFTAPTFQPLSIPK